MLSYIQKKKHSPANADPTAQGTPPLDYENGGLESSGQRLISLNAKTKSINFFGKNTLWAQSSFCSGFISRIQEKPET